jgi:hypothetical protein
MSDAPDQRLYHFDEGVLTLPRGFRDRSTHTLEWPIDNSSSVVLVIQRERLGWGTFDDFFRQETREYGAEFLGFRVEETEYPDPFEGSLPIRRMVFRYKGERDVLYHHQVFVFSAPLVLVFTAKATVIHRERADRIMKEALSGLRFREE